MPLPTRRRALFAAFLAVLALAAGFAVVRLATVTPPSGEPVETSGAPENDEAGAGSPGVVVLSGRAASPPGTRGADDLAASDAPDTSPEGQLVAAAGEGHLARVRELLANGVPADARSGGTLAVHQAVGAVSLPVLEELAAAGANLEAVDQYGNTALNRAAMFGYAGIVRFLLEAGADPNAFAEPNNQPPLVGLLFGWTVGRSPNPLGITAREEERIEAARALLAAGADPDFAPGHLSAAMLAGTIGGEIQALLAGEPDGSPPPPN